MRSVGLRRVAATLAMLLASLGVLSGSSAQTQAGSTPANAAEAAPDSEVRLDLEVFGGYRHALTDAGGPSAFVLDRAEVGAAFDWRRRGGVELRLESVRAAGPDSAFGVDGNSLLVRVKRAWGYLAFDFEPARLTLGAGLVPDPWVATLEPHYAARDLAPLLSEGGAFFDTSDLGASLALALWDRLTLHAAFSNGEGRNEVERNGGKNLTLVLSGSLLDVQLGGEPGTLVAAASWRDGSLGFGSAQNHRLAGAFVFDHARWFGGVEVAHAQGYGGRADLDVLGVGGWAGGFVWERWIGVAARIDWLSPQPSEDAGDADADELRLRLALMSEPLVDIPGLERLRVLVAWDRHQPGTDAAPLSGAANAVTTDALTLTLSLWGVARWNLEDSR